MFIFKASNFKSRTDLENAVRNKFGLTTQKKEAQIHGSKEELKILSLEHESNFWSIMCVETEPPNGFLTVSLTPQKLGVIVKRLRKIKKAPKLVKKSKKLIKKSNKK